MLKIFHLPAGSPTSPSRFERMKGVPGMCWHPKSSSSFCGARVIEAGTNDPWIVCPKLYLLFGGWFPLLLKRERDTVARFWQVMWLCVLRKGTGYRMLRIKAWKQYCALKRLVDLNEALHSVSSVVSSNTQASIVNFISHIYLGIESNILDSKICMQIGRRSHHLFQRN
jgi:hypothetical protein